MVYIALAKHSSYPQGEWSAFSLSISIDNSDHKDWSGSTVKLHRHLAEGDLTVSANKKEYHEQDSTVLSEIS